MKNLLISLLLCILAMGAQAQRQPRLEHRDNSTARIVVNDRPMLMIGGKLQGITRDDAIQFARDNGIRRPDAIIRDVVASLKQFYTIATKYGVSDEWTGRVETTIIDHLKAWGEWEEDE